MDIQFFEDFERTEYSDFIHGVIGRSLIIATRFDRSCNELAMAIEYKQGFIEAKTTDDFDNFVDKVFSKYRSLNNSIELLKLPNDICTTLDNARKARNEIAHSLCKGLDGCADLRTNESQFIKEVSKLIEDVTCGDIVISQLTHIFNKDLIHINDGFVKKYQEDILNWVMEQ